MICCVWIFNFLKFFSHSHLTCPRLAGNQKNKKHQKNNLHRPINSLGLYPPHERVRDENYISKVFHRKYSQAHTCFFYCVVEENRITTFFLLLFHRSEQRVFVWKDSYSCNDSATFLDTHKRRFIFRMNSIVTQLKIRRSLKEESFFFLFHIELVNKTANRDKRWKLLLKNDEERGQPRKCWGFVLLLLKL
jgi:hypothetical protein